jgi:hypothetical protein
MNNNTKHKIYCFNNGGSPGWYDALAIADDGHVLAGHICSHEGYMRHDLGMDGSTWKHEHYNKHFGENNWELEWIETDKLGVHEGLNKAIALNKQLPKEEAVNEEAMPKVEVTFSEEPNQ